MRDILLFDTNTLRRMTNEPVECIQVFLGRLVNSMNPLSIRDIPAGEHHAATQTIQFQQRFDFAPHFGIGGRIHEV
eukprot:scaffold10856_cov229-Amphora_coffeaeformis.AAC.2